MHCVTLSPPRCAIPPQTCFSFSRYPSACWLAFPLPSYLLSPELGDFDISGSNKCHSWAQEHRNHLPCQMTIQPSQRPLTNLTFQDSNTENGTKRCNSWAMNWSLKHSPHGRFQTWARPHTPPSEVLFWFFNSQLGAGPRHSWPLGNCALHCFCCWGRGSQPVCPDYFSSPWITLLSSTSSYWEYFPLSSPLYYIQTS